MHRSNSFLLLVLLAQACGTALRPSLLQGRHASSTSTSQAPPLHPPLSVVKLSHIYKAARANPSLLTAARETTDTLLLSGRLSTVKDCHAAISIYKLSSSSLHFDAALGVLEYMDSQKIRPDTFLYNNLLDLCARSAASGAASTYRHDYSESESEDEDSNESVKTALKLLQKMRQLGIPRDATSYTSAIQACSAAGQWRKAILLLQEMSEASVVPDTIAYSAVVQGCTRAGRWKEALSIIHIMKSNKVRLDAILCNSVIKACASAGEWELALKIIDTMKAEGIALDAYTFTSAICACDKAGREDQAVALLDEYASTAKISLKAAPFNAALVSLLRSGHGVPQALAIYQRMQQLGVPRSAITYTSLLTGLAKLGQWESVLEVYTSMLCENEDFQQSSDAHLVPTEAALGSALKACDKLGRPVEALSVFRHIQRVLFSGQEGGLQGPPSTQYWNMLLSSHSRHAAFDDVSGFLSEMNQLGASLTAETYTSLISCCKSEGRLDDASQLLAQYEQSDVYDRANAYPYVAMISVCVESKQWSTALDVLEKMERLRVPISRVAFNSAIEALDAAGETLRAEIVYQSALRAGIYQHWADETSDVSAKSVSGARCMDLHHFPTAVARAAVMHALGEMCSGRAPLAEPLYIITGRGNSIDVAAGQVERGVLRSDMASFVSAIGLRLSPSSNPGRLRIDKASIEAWLEVQREDDVQKRQSGKTHGNLFLAVARAINRDKSVVDVKAVCPFSSAASTNSISVVPNPAAAATIANTATSGAITATAEASPVPAVKKGVCPAHANAATTTADSTLTSVSASVVESPVAQQTKGGGCPAHAKPVAEPAAIAAAAKGVCPAHAKLESPAQAAPTSPVAAPTSPVAAAASVTMSGGGGCPAHAVSKAVPPSAVTEGEKDAAAPAAGAKSSLGGTGKGGCPAHSH